MRGFRLFPKEPRLQFISRHRLFFMASAVLIVLSLGSLGTRGLNFGIDFIGGIAMEVQTKPGVGVADMRAALSGQGLGDVSLQEFGAADTILIRIQEQEGGADAQNQAIVRVKEVLQDLVVDYRRTEAVGPKVSSELLFAGLQAVSLSLLFIMIYIWFRFEWQFGVGAVAALFHDIITTVGLFSLLGLEFNLSTVAAMLTIAGYSINDTVVVFDRVRENLRKYKKMPLPELFNLSINGTLSRTVMTSVTTLLALVALYVLGGENLRGFSFAMIWGVLVGTYSSICIAVPLMLYLKLNRSVVESGGEPDNGGAAEENA